MKAFIIKHPVAGFIILTFIFSYLIGLPLKQLVFNNIFAHKEIANYYFSKIIIVFGPALAAIIVNAAISGKKGVGVLLNKLKPDSNYAKWWLILPVAGLIITFFSFWLGRFATADLLKSISSNWQLLVMHFAAAVFIIGIGEELGWRGWLLPHLAKNNTILNSTLIVFVTWLLWHLPILLSGYRVAIPFVLMVLALSFVFTWLFYKVNGNIFVLAIAHASVDFPEVFYENHLHTSVGSSQFLHVWTILSIVYLLIAAVIFFSDRNWWKISRET